MFWAVLGAAFGAASKDANGSVYAPTIVGATLLAYLCLFYFSIRRAQARSRQRRGGEGD